MAYYENIKHFNKRLVVVVKALALTSKLITGGIKSDLHIVYFQIVVKRNILLISMKGEKINSSLINIYFILHFGHNVVF